VSTEVVEQERQFMAWEVLIALKFLPHTVVAVAQPIPAGIQLAQPEQSRLRPEEERQRVVTIAKLTPVLFAIPLMAVLAFTKAVQIQVLLLKQATFIAPVATALIPAE